MVANHKQYRWVLQSLQSQSRLLLTTNKGSLHTSSDCFNSSSSAQTGWFISHFLVLYKLLLNKIAHVFQSMYAYNPEVRLCALVCCILLFHSFQSVDAYSLYNSFRRCWCFIRSWRKRDVGRWTWKDWKKVYVTRCQGCRHAQNGWYWLLWVKQLFWHCLYLYASL